MKTGRLLFALTMFCALPVLLVKGCEYFPESSFELANDSRLPKWIVLPSGLGRSDVSLTMNYPSLPIMNDAQFILKDRHGKVIAKVSGKKQDLSTGRSLSDYPAYVTITVNGVTDIIEHRRMEPIFYVTDDPAVWKKPASE